MTHSIRREIYDLRSVIVIGDGKGEGRRLTLRPIIYCQSNSRVTACKVESLTSAVEAQITGIHP